MQRTKCKVQLNPAHASFRSLIVWQKAQDLAVTVTAVISALPQDRGSQVIANQLLRAAGSVPANIAEGYGRYSELAFRNHLSIARGSLYETMSWVDLLLRSAKISDEQSVLLIKDCEEVARLITSTMKPMSSARRSLK